MNERMKEILVEVEKDPRNRDYTERGIYPIVQISRLYLQQAVFTLNKLG